MGIWLARGRVGM